VGVKNVYSDDDIETSQQTDGNDATADDGFPGTYENTVAFETPEVSDGNVRCLHICLTAA
jgi:hypothetical protein